MPLQTDHKVVHEPRSKYIYLALNGDYSESVLLLLYHHLKINTSAEMHERELVVKVNILYK